MPGPLTRGGDTILGAVAAVVRYHGARAWLVGGSVRDFELGRDSPDIDVVVTGDAAAIARDVARLLDRPWFTLSAEHAAYRVVAEHAHLDVAAMRGGDIVADLGLRDFTLNAMAMPLGEDGTLGGLVDPFGGLADLRAMRLAVVSEGVFADDPLRLMRAARFAHVFGLRIEPVVEASIRAQVEAIKKAAPERTLAEMVLTLDAGRAGDAARLWQALGLLEAVLPESEDQKAAGTLASWLNRVDARMARPHEVFPEAGGRLAERLARPVDGQVGRPTAVRLAGLLRLVAPDRAAAVGRRLKLSGSMMSLAVTAARMRACEPLPAVRPSAERPGRDAVRFLWAAAPWEPEIILVADGDGRALMAAWAARAAGDAPRLPFGGDELMKELGLGPGPLLGRALRAARLAWEAGEAATEAEALSAARAALAESRRHDGPD